MKSFVINQMTSKETVKLMMIGSEYETFKQLSEKLEITKSTFQSALDNNSLRVRDLQKVADLLGYEIKIEKK